MSRINSSRKEGEIQALAEDWSITSQNWWVINVFKVSLRYYHENEEPAIHACYFMKFMHCRNGILPWRGPSITPVYHRRRFKEKIQYQGKRWSFHSKSLFSSVNTGFVYLERLYKLFFYIPPLLPFVFFLWRWDLYASTTEKWLIC
jgi:hypothetical protein